MNLGDRQQTLTYYLQLCLFCRKAEYISITILTQYTKFPNKEYYQKWNSIFEEVEVEHT